MAKNTKSTTVAEINRADRLDNLERQMSTLIGLMAGNTAHTPPAVQVPDATLQRQIDGAKSVKGYTANGARILAPVQPAKATPPAFAYELDAGKYGTGVKMTFHGRKVARWVYVNELRELRKHIDAILAETKHIKE
jgi:hypothetical protein